MIIHRAYLNDVEKVADLFDQYRQFYQQPSDVSVAKAFLTERIAAHESVIFLAKSDHDEALGFVQLYPCFSSISAKRSWILNDLFVVDSMRGKGIGKALLNEAKLLAQQSGAQGLTLQTHVSNLEAQRLYESLGYVKETQFCSYYLPV